MTDQTRNMAKSVHDRLLNIARDTARPYNELQQRFAMERFLYRLCSSSFADQFILKGALAFLTWTGAGGLHRPTLDIDLLGRTSSSEENLLKVFRSLCLEPVQEDGLRFDPDGVALESIADAAEHQGIRVRVPGRLGNARLVVQIDIGFSDVPVPEPVRAELPALLDFPPPSMSVYRPEATIAEKFQTMLDLGLRNSRMKDFADLWYLSRRFSFDGDVLANAVSQTCRRRKTPIPAAPVPLSAEFADDPGKQTQWSAFLRKGQLSNLPQQFSEVIAVLRAFLMPLVGAIATGRAFRGQWTAPGPWAAE